jgi:hypothetical protein
MDVNDNPLWDESAVKLGEHDGELVRPGESGHQLKYHSPRKHGSPLDGSLQDSYPAQGKLPKTVSWAEDEA